MDIDIGTFTAIHTALSLIALVWGFLAVLSLFSAAVSRIWIPLFLVLAVVTTVTGFFFPFNGVTPAFATGIVTSVILIAVFVARYLGHLVGTWRWIYAAGIVANLYFMVFVTIAQIFTKVPILQDAATTASPILFGFSQLATLAAFILLGIKASKEFKPIL